ncbi:MAG TPA: dihydroorotate dehydrogenase electron transfer subunit [Segeticoccus sp.]|nr:dihydroorotate dehydrogenase electron transfer subunit [Segeticoccus sp.]
MTGRPARAEVEVVATRAQGAHQQLTLLAPQVADAARPGQFVAVRIGGPTSAQLLPRHLFVQRVNPSASYGGTVDVRVARRGVGTGWLADLPVHARVPVVGPLGRPFPLPRDPAPCVLVGEGWGASPLPWLATVLRERGCPVGLVLLGEGDDDSPGALEARRAGVRVHPAGTADAVEALDSAARELDAAVAYVSTSSLPSARSLAGHLTDRGLATQVVLPVPMPCGTGLCGRCSVAVSDSGGAPRRVRACVEGPVLPGSRVTWRELEDGGVVPVATTSDGAVS